jgi:anthranilate phosphoribosyltransferase
VLSGKAGAERSLTVLNAGAALYVGGVSASIQDGTRAAEEAIDAGAAAELLARFAERTQALAPAT